MTAGASFVFWRRLGEGRLAAVGREAHLGAGEYRGDADPEGLGDGGYGLDAEEALGVERVQDGTSAEARLRDDGVDSDLTCGTFASQLGRYGCV